MNQPSRMRLRGAAVVGACLVLAVGLARAAESPPSVPRPCFVLPHPKKIGGPPKIENPRIGAKLSIPVGGAGMAYHDDHLRAEPGVLGAAAPPSQPLRAIAILVDFDDAEMGADFESQREDSTRAYFERVMLFLHQMYDQMSGGTVDIQWDLTPSVYRLPEPMAYYGLDDSIATREADLCRDAVNAADPDVDFTQYNRYLLFHAGAGQEADINDDSREQIWSVFFRQIDFQFWLDAPDAEKGILTADTTMATGEAFYVDHMTILPENQSQDGFSFGILGVVAHEFGHSFGLPDLYDTTADDDFIFADSQGIGAFGLMGAGIWNLNGFFPAEMCAWSKFYVGWLRPRVIRPSDAGGEILESLDGVQNDRFLGAIRMPLGGDEYFLIENRLHDYDGDGLFDFEDTGLDGFFDFWEDSYAGCEFDWYLPQELNANRAPGEDGSGLLIWHIDESIVRDLLLYNLVNANALHKGVDLEEADGIQDLDKLKFTFEAFGDSRDSFWAPYATAFTPHTEPNTDGYGGAHTGVWITDISGPGPTMSMKIRFDAPGGGEAGDIRIGWPRDLPGRVRDFQPVTADLDGDGNQEIIVGVTDDTGEGGLVVLNDDGTPFFSELLSSHGRLRSDPIVVNLDGAADPNPEIVWVSADTVYCRKGSGVYVRNDGTESAIPSPYFLLGEDPGRVYLSAGHIEPPSLVPVCGGPAGDSLPEILISVPAAGQPGYSDLHAIAYPQQPGLDTTHDRVLASIAGDVRLHHTLANVDNVDWGQREIVSSVRTASGGYVAVTVFDNLDVGSCEFTDVRTVSFSSDDSTAFSAPVAGDLDRDGTDEIVVADSEGMVHALSVRVRSDGSGFKEVTGIDELPGWPVDVGALEDDALSLADVDGDGLLEVLAMGAGNRLHVINYNGTSILSLPVEVPGEDRFTDPYLAPMVLDIEGGDEPEILVPLPDGQVRGHDLSGRPLDDWDYLGGGDQRTYPVVVDLEGNGSLQMVAVEDVTTAVPPDDLILNGDEADVLPKQGRVVVREVGSATGLGPWPVFRQDPGRIGRAPTSREGIVEPSGLITEVFVVPNPVVRRQDAGFHYQVPSSVRDLNGSVTIEVFTAAGRPVTRFDGSVFPSTDNLVTWDLTNDRGSPVAPGLYVARVAVEAGSRREVHTMRFVVVR